MDIKKPEANARKRRNRHNVWRSYSDMMAGLLLLFILVMVVVFIEAQLNYEENLGLIEWETELSGKLADSEEEVAELRQLIRKLRELLALWREKCNILREKMRKQEIISKGLLKKVKDQEIQIEDQRARIDDQESLMAEQQNMIDNIIGVKAQLIEKLQKKFEENNINAQIDEETGAITFTSDILFEFGEYTLKSEGIELLNQMLPVYCDILLSDDYEEYLAEIIIDGFADPVGGYEYNLKLSQQRALAVAEHLLAVEKNKLSEKKMNTLMEKLTANGRSSSNLVMNAENEADNDASRRVEIKFRLKDAEMIEELQKIIHQQ